MYTPSCQEQLTIYTEQFFGLHYRPVSTNAAQPVCLIFPLYLLFLQLWQNKIFVRLCEINSLANQTRVLETTDLFITELQSVSLDLCLGFGRCSLLSRLLLGFQHLGLDLWRERTTFQSHNR